MTLPSEIESVFRREEVNSRVWHVTRRFFASTTVREPVADLLDRCEAVLAQARQSVCVEIRILPEDCATFEDAEKALTLRIFKETGMNACRAAERLGIGKTTMFRKLKKWGIRLKTPEEEKLLKKIALMESELADLRSRAQPNSAPPAPTQE